MAHTTEAARTAEPPPGPDRHPKPGGRGVRPAPVPLTRRITRSLPPYALIAPAVVVLGVVLLWPMLQMVWNSLHSYTIRHLMPAGPDPEWNDFAHYRTLLTDPYFWSVLGKTVLVCVTMVVCTIVLGTLVGLLLNRLPKAFSTFVAVGTMLAWATPAISASLVFRWLFFPERGFANHVLDALPDLLVGSGWLRYNWFLDEGPLFTLLVLVVVWQGFPFVAMTVLAGLKSIPYELYEAARMDGASAWRSFWAVTVPILRPLFALIVVLQIIWDLRVFTQLYILTGSSFANPDAYLLSYYVYQQGFNASPANFGLGSAIAVVMTVLVLGITVYYLRVMIRQGETR
ncbi:carbohydrate ABC transporter permease [Actinorugispora endophytica]|uniref:N,N'-diacetylchitobiose transport system permease protein n=1 Tax=Actinorugispora endophytica TaxID=1605990 RepID=A0A4R6UXI2_9ACTN|nr:sugar ABC transporter permease [Actinorugispora endophytica]TDQ52109.1 N,N'-diacetylchitobiose transport system permease protein [Actinorugispora endophytica]